MTRRAAPTLALLAAVAAAVVAAASAEWTLAIRSITLAHGPDISEVHRLALHRLTRSSTDWLGAPPTYLSSIDSV